MPNLMIRIHNIETNEVIDREMNAKELAQYKIDQESAANAEAELAAKLIAKQAVLDKLGLTADELAAALS